MDQVKRTRAGPPFDAVGDRSAMIGLGEHMR
jgi:hypothetical protein